MKNTKITKIALLVLSLALLACVSFAVSAEETSNEVEILAKNVIYGDQIRVAFAVDATIEEALEDNVKLAYKWGENGEVKNAVVLNPEESANNVYEEQYPVFAIEGVAPKNLADVVYATAYTGDAPADDAKWITYSAAEYFYARLYKDGFINKTEADDTEKDKDYSRKLLYLAQLDVAKYAQVVLNHQADKPVDKYSYVYTTSELVSFNGASAVFGYGELNPAVEYSGEGVIVGWTLTDVDGGVSEIETGDLVATGIYHAEPVVGGHDCVDAAPADHICDICKGVISVCATYDDDHHCDVCGKAWITSCGESCDIDKNGIVNDCYNISFEKDSYSSNGYFHIGSATDTKSNFTVDTLQSYNTITGTAPTYGSYGTYMNMVTDPLNESGDKVLKVYTKAYTNTNLVGNIPVTESASYATLGYLTFTPVVLEDNADIIVFEFDFLMGSQTAKKAGAYYCHQYADGTGNGGNLFYTWTTTTSSSLGSFTEKSNLGFTDSAWARIRIAYKADGSSDTAWAWGSSDNGQTWVSLGTWKGIVKGTLENVGICFNGVGTTSTFYFDNMSCVLTTEESAGITLN